MIRGPSDMGQTNAFESSSSRSLSENPPFGADESRDVRLPQLRDCLQRRRNRGALVAQNDGPALLASLEQGLSLIGFSMLVISMR